MGLAGTELIFFLEAQSVLCFGSVTGAVLVTHQNLAAAEQSLQRDKAFPFSCSVSSVSGLGVCKKLRRDTTRTADPKGPEGYSMPDNIMHSNAPKLQEGSFGEVAIAKTAQRLLSIRVLEGSDD